MSALALADVAPSNVKAQDRTLVATMFCRAATAAERPAATIGSVAVVCKKMPVGMLVMSGQGGPDLSKALSAEQVDRAWREFVTSALMVRTGDGGG